MHIFENINNLNSKMFAHEEIYDLYAESRFLIDGNEIFIWPNHTSLIQYPVSKKLNIISSSIEASFSDRFGEMTFIGGFLYLPNKIVRYVFYKYESSTICDLSTFLFERIEDFQTTKMIDFRSMR